MATIKVDKPAYESHRASGTLDKYKSDLVGALIAKEYNINDQIALLRYALQGLKLEKLQKFNSYANQCVATVNGWFEAIERGEYVW